MVYFSLIIHCFLRDLLSAQDKPGRPKGQWRYAEDKKDVWSRERGISYTSPDSGWAPSLTLNGAEKQAVAESGW